MQFRTEVKPPPCPFSLEHASPLFSIGSCFSEHIAERLKSYRFQVLENPFGVLYNPHSIMRVLQQVQKQQRFGKSDLVFHDGEWHSFDHHSAFSSHDADAVLNAVNNRIGETHRWLCKTNVCLITYGTAYVYFHKERGQVVANCHKIPQEAFERSRLTPAEVREVLQQTLDILKRFNPDMKTIVTVSPIRHLKDGAVGNQRSKAALILGIAETVASRDDVYYFPSYEIMMDDLRDYRFYDTSLNHPSAMAVDYIWKTFTETCLSEAATEAVREIEKLNNARSHQVRNPQSPAHQTFLKQTLAYLDYLSDKYRYVDFRNDYQYFKQGLQGDET